MRPGNSSFRCVVAVVSAMLAACVSSPGSLPPSQSFAEDAISGRLDLADFDFAEAGYWALSPERKLAWRSPVEQRIFGKAITTQTCEYDERRRFAAAMWLQLLVQSPDESTWATSWRAVRQALATLDADIQEAAAKVAPAKDARLMELARRVARDQVTRDPASSGRQSAGVPTLAQGPGSALLLTRMVSIDCDNTAWLQRQLREIGWFDISSYGAAADKDAWLLVQHADRTPEFQREVLALLRTLEPGRTDRRNLAYLEDRVATAEQRPQRFGTQGQCTPDGRWSPQPIEDPEGVDARRAALGMPTMAEYEKLFAGLCPKVSSTALP